LNKVAVVPNPRISDAAMMSALFNAGAGGRDYPPHFAAFGRQAMNTADAKTLRKLFQFIHDHAAAHGAHCQNLEGHGQLPHSQRAGHLEDYGAHGNDRELILRSAAGLSAPFAAKPDVGLQQMHDLAASLLGSGAACAQYRLLMSGKGVSTPSYLPGQYQAAAVATLPAFRDYEPGRYYSSAGLSDDYAYYEGAGATTDAGAEFNEYGQAPFAAATLSAWAQEAAYAAEQYAAKRNRDLAFNASSGLDAAADLPPNR
jgi:hypothetical protein